MRGFWLVLGLVGCVEVPDRVFAAGDGDGFGWGDFEVRPDGWRAVDGDGDGGESVVVDGGRLERDAWSGREDGAVAGDQVGRGELVAAVDGGRCPGGGGWLPGLDRCVGVEVLGRLPEGRVGLVGAVTESGRVWVGGGRGEGGVGAGSWVLGEGERGEDGEWGVGPALAVGVVGARGVAVGEAVWVVGGEGSGRVVQRVVLEGTGGEGAEGEGAVEGGSEVAARLGVARAGGFSVVAVGAGVMVVGGAVLEGAGDEGAVAGVEFVGVQGVAPQLGVARRDHGVAVDGAGAVWVVGGVDGVGVARLGPEVLRVDGGAERRAWQGAVDVAGWGFWDGGVAWAGGLLVVAGGVDGAGAVTARAVALGDGGWREVGGLNAGQRALTLTALGDEGALLAVGPVSVEVFDPVAGGFFRVDHLVGGGARTGHVALAVEGGVVVVGGEQDGRLSPSGFRVVLSPAVAVGGDEGGKDGREEGRE